MHLNVYSLLQNLETVFTLKNIACFYIHQAIDCHLLPPKVPNETNVSFPDFVYVENCAKISPISEYKNPVVGTDYMGIMTMTYVYLYLNDNNRVPL